MKPLRLSCAVVLSLIPAGVFYGWGIQALVVFGLSLVAVLVLDAVRKQPNKTAFISNWPNISIQWDSAMSQAQILDFLDKVRAHVLANPLAKPKNTKQQGSTDNTSGPKEQPSD